EDPDRQVDVGQLGPERGEWIGSRIDDVGVEVRRHGPGSQDGDGTAHRNEHRESANDPHCAKEARVTCRPVNGPSGSASRTAAPPWRVPGRAPYRTPRTFRFPMRPTTVTRRTSRGPCNQSFVPGPVPKVAPSLPSVIATTVPAELVRVYALYPRPIGPPATGVALPTRSASVRSAMASMRGV